MNGTGGISEGEGIIEPLEQGEEIELMHETDQSGVYVFVVYQHEEHPDKEEVWSEKIQVMCEQTNENQKAS